MYQRHLLTFVHRLADGSTCRSSAVQKPIIMPSNAGSRPLYLSFLTKSGRRWTHRSAKGDVVPWDRGCYSCHANQYRNPASHRRINCIVGCETRQHAFQPNERTAFPANAVYQHREDGVDIGEENTGAVTMKIYCRMKLWTRKRWQRGLWLL
ncbi:hypothetical protein DL98DRAFT_191856 [Cadophora sp. DSE1049]|nr:hypothetical protein DL98DRAFT_191856 [Cadophora sp. DSE1049]